MSNIVELHEHLPDNLKDLSAFILVGREKLTAVRAEIRAIQKLELAEEVRQQKMDEARMLSEALLDAEVKIGELTKLIPKAKNQYDALRSDAKSKPSNSGVTKLNEEPVHTAVNRFQEIEITQPTKAQVINEMGFNKDQVSRFETLADNKDLVEQVKAEARENNIIPTRGKVLELAKERKEERNPAYVKIENETKICLAYHDAIYKPLLLDVNETSFRIWQENSIDRDIDGVNMQILDVELAIKKLSQIKQMLLDNQKIRVIKG